MSPLFYLFSALALFGGLGVVLFRNPVSAAFAMVMSFLGLAALFIQLDAFLVGVLQILVYAGAIMVLFIFIIMLLNVPEEEKKRFPLFSAVAAGGIAMLFAGVIFLVQAKSKIGDASFPELGADDGSTDVHHIGELLFGTYWFPVQVVGILLLVATVGVVVLSKKELK